MFYSNITDITIISGSTSEMMVLNRCAIIDEKPSDDLVYSLSKETLKEDPEMPQLIDCRITRCKLPKALYKECVYIDKEGARIISGKGYLKREATENKK